MTLKNKIRKALVERYGKFNSYLEQTYENKVIENLITGDMEDKKAWVTYNQVILELKHTLKDKLRLQELQYGLTENSNPNEVCIQVIESVKHRSKELERLYNKINNFA